MRPPRACAGRIVFSRISSPRAVHKTTVEGDEHLPHQSALIFPLMSVLARAGGSAASRAVQEALADAVGVSERRRRRQVLVGRNRRRVNEWGRHVRWVRQQASLAGFVHAPDSGVWTLTDRGDQALHNARPGIVVTVFVTDLGTMLWGEVHDSVDVIANDTLDLFLSSLPYPDQRKPYESQHPEREHVDWVLRIAERIRPKLRENGSLVLNLAAPFERGRPAESTWIHRLVLRMVDELNLVLCQTLYWHNPAKLPSPAEWVCIRKERFTPDVESILWFAKHAHPFADTAAGGVLRPYSRAMQKRIQRGGEAAAQRPSGHSLSEGAFGRDNGGAIPGTLLSAANTDSNSYYFRRCREAAIPPHPARFPRGLPERVIGALTPVGGIVADLCGGSGETAAAAERMRRRWICSDLALTYIRGSSFHFERTPGFRSFLPPALRPTPARQGDLFS